MFFEQECLLFKIIDVVVLDQVHVSATMTGRNFDALSYRFSANTVLKTETSNISVSDGSVVFTPSRVNYSRATEKDRLIAVHFHAENYFSKEIEHFSATNRAFFEEKFQALWHAWETKEPAYQYTCTALLCEILRECYLENHKEAKSYGIIDASVKYLHAHITDPNLTVAEIAAKSFVSVVYFRKLFRRFFGISPVKYIIQLRIQHAIGLMATGYYSLKEVALLSGYTEYPYFSTEFKRIKGVSPSEYRYD